MKSSYIFLIFFALIAALTAGWFIESRPAVVITNSLEVPDNIDYYLAEVNYRVFNDSGEPSYQLQAPYLEHFIREDLSQITQPDIQYYAENNQWQMTADQGTLKHEKEILELSQQVRLKRVDLNNPLLLTSELMVFTPNDEQLEIPQKLQVKTNDLELQADSALMDIKNNRHEFHHVKAIYQQEKS